MSKPFKKVAKTDRYLVAGEVTEAQILVMANTIVKRRFRRGTSMTTPLQTREYLMVKHASLEHELFSVIFLDNKHRVLAYEEMFRGTISSASVYPREVVKSALVHNAAAVILTHNHPSGVAEPSQSDIHITKRIQQALELVDIRTLDHIIVAGTESVSLAERGLL